MAAELTGCDGLEHQRAAGPEVGMNWGRFGPLGGAPAWCGRSCCPAGVPDTPLWLAGLGEEEQEGEKVLGVGGWRRRWREGGDDLIRHPTCSHSQSLSG